MSTEHELDKSSINTSREKIKRLSESLINFGCATGRLSIVTIGLMITLTANSSEYKDLIAESIKKWKKKNI